MIRKEDLMIGNKLNYLTSDGDILVTTLDWQDLKRVSENEKGFNLFHSPIPLTEDMLLNNLGAVKLAFKDFPSYSLKGVQINFIDGLWIEYVSRVEIKGLHHLQNIFNVRNEKLVINF